MSLRSSAREHLDDPVFMRSFHGWATVVWFAAAFPICIFLSTNLPALIFMSVYAIVSGHFSAWQAAGAEEAAEED